VKHGESAFFPAQNTFQTNLPVRRSYFLPVRRSYFPDSWNS